MMLYTIRPHNVDRVWRFALLLVATLFVLGVTVEDAYATPPGVDDATQSYPTYQVFYPQDNVTLGYLGGSGDVMISPDGLSAIAGLPSWNDNGLIVNGGAYVFLKDPATNKWSFASHLTVPDYAFDPKVNTYTGMGPSISNNGKVAAFGESADKSNGMYIFERQGQNKVWSFIGYKVLPCESDANTYYSSMSEDGYAVAISGNDTAECHVVVISKRSGTWQRQIIPVDPNSPVPQSGSTSRTTFAKKGLELFARGKYCCISVYTRNEATGLYEFLTAFTAAPNFGFDFSVSSDGTKVVTQQSAHTSNGVDFFIRTGNTFNYVSSIPRPSFGFSFPGKVRLFLNGARLMVGDSGFISTRNNVGAGGAFFFQLEGTVWNLTSVLANPDQHDQSQFGYNLDISEDGTSLMVSAYRDLTDLGAVFFFDGQPPDCAPSNGMNHQDCTKKINKCKKKGIKMKWSGKGCRVNGQVLGDGGCQCNNYCGYTCSRACGSDHQCVWSKATNQCLVKATLKPSDQMSICT